MARRGHYEEAIDHYMEALVLANGRISYVLAFARALVEANRTREAETYLMELLRQKDDIPEDPELKKRLGRLFLTARSPEEARDVFADVTRTSPRDAAAWQYLLAKTAYRQAVRYNTNDLQTRTQLELSNEIVELNPMLRGLTLATRLARSKKLIDRTLTEYGTCTSDRLNVLPESFQKDAAKARQAREEDTVEANVDLAERLYDTGKKLCGSPPAPD